MIESFVFLSGFAGLVYCIKIKAPHSKGTWSSLVYCEGLLRSALSVVAPAPPMRQLRQLQRLRPSQYLKLRSCKRPRVDFNKQKFGVCSMRRQRSGHSPRRCFRLLTGTHLPHPTPSLSCTVRVQNRLSRVGAGDARSCKPQSRLIDTRGQPPHPKPLLHPHGC